MQWHFNGWIPHHLLVLVWGLPNVNTKKPSKDNLMSTCIYLRVCVYTVADVFSSNEQILK